MLRQKGADGRSIVRYKSAGFLVILTGVGVIIAAGGQWLVRVFPYASVAIGGGMALRSPPERPVPAWRGRLPDLLLALHRRPVGGFGARDITGFATKFCLDYNNLLNSRLTGAHTENVNRVLPGTIDPPLNRESMPKADHSRWVPPEAIADAILFLASDAAWAVNGAAMPVYGKS